MAADPMPLALAQTIEHTYLQPAGEAQAISKLCEQAKAWHMGAICVLPYWIPWAKQQLGETSCRITAVIGFPWGSCATEAKVVESQLALAAGADELDMVIHLPAVGAQDWQRVHDDVACVVQVAQPHPVKVILEVGLFDQERWLTSALWAQQAGAAYIKTCTGFGPGQATPAIIASLRQHLPAQCKIKASGGITDRQLAYQLLQAGADRLGTSKGHVLLAESLQGVKAASSPRPEITY